jgi:cell division protein FtsW
MFCHRRRLAVFGTMMVYSASAMISSRETNGASQFTYFYKQFGFTAIGLVAMFVASRVDYRRYQAPWFVYGSLGFTVICFVAVFAFPEINGASRWIRFAGLSFQPSEIAKITLPLFLAFFLTKNESSVGDLKSTVVPCIGALFYWAV